MSTLKSPLPTDAPEAADYATVAVPRRRTKMQYFVRGVIVFAIAGAVIVLIAGIFGYKLMGFIKLAKSGAFAPPPAAVSTFKVHSETWQPRLPAIGSLEAVQGVTVSADLPGIIKEIRFESGAAVRQGDILAHLVTDQEEAQAESAAANRDLMLVTLKRAKDLREKNANSQSDLDAAEANERQAEAALANAKAAIDRKTIRAPFAGLLGIRKVSVGQYLNSGDQVVPLQSMDPIYVNFTLPQQNLRDFGVGASIELKTDATGTQIFPGKVNAINSMVDTATRNFQAQATVSNPDARLRPGMYATVDVILGGDDKVLPVPQSAINYAPYGNSIFVIVHDLKVPADPAAGTEEKILPLAVKQQFVKLGQTRGDMVAVVSGLKDGDEIVSSGVFKLQNSAPVQINNAVKPEAEENPHPEES